MGLIERASLCLRTPATTPILGVQFIKGILGVQYISGTLGVHYTSGILGEQYISGVLGVKCTSGILGVQYINGIYYMGTEVTILHDVWKILFLLCSLRDVKLY
jgi:hypothetical protein